MESHANGTVAPDNIAYVILPKRLEPYQNMLHVSPEKMEFVASTGAKIPYNIGNHTVGNMEIQVPDYERALRELEGVLFTHMLRSPTEGDLQELG